MSIHELRLSEILKAKYINLELKATDKKGVLLELAEIVAKCSKLKDKKLFLKTMVEREKLGSTGIGNGVAMPHAKLENLSDFILAFGRVNNGIDFGALDCEKTFLFFVLASPKNEVGGHLKIMAKISHLIKDKFIIEKIKHAATKEEVIRIISTYEK